MTHLIALSAHDVPVLFSYQDLLAFYLLNFLLKVNMYTKKCLMIFHKVHLCDQRPDKEVGITSTADSPLCPMSVTVTGNHSPDFWH